MWKATVARDKRIRDYMCSADRVARIWLRTWAFAYIIWPVRSYLLLLGALCASACQFDESGLRAVYDSGTVSPVADSSVQPLADAGDTSADAPPPPDASLAPCVDSDGDTFLVVNLPGAECPGPLDCDDTDPDAYPGQESYYDHQRASGGYDYDCDGNETRLNTTAGGNCRWDWWSCVGTGWVGGVPTCGNVGSWHSCEDVGGDCQETSSVTAMMACR